jgi:hypothetical protein
MIPNARDIWTFVGLPLAGRPFVFAVQLPRPGRKVRPYSLKITGRWYNMPADKNPGQ